MNINQVCVPINTVSKYKKWLDSKVGDITITNKMEIFKNTITPYKSKNDILTYYENDDDFDDQYEELHDYIIYGGSLDSKKILDVSKYIDHTLIPINTNRYHANYLFRQLIDYAIENNMKYTFQEKCIGFLVDKSMKDNFYKFCYNNS
jgi:hypothetical protein